jgi:hypothetical protein
MTNKLDEFVSSRSGQERNLGKGRNRGSEDRFSISMFEYKL